jgi:putative acetyltransferase
MDIRPATPADHLAIHDVNHAAFGREDEADLVDRLRRDGEALMEIVAVEEGRVIGHILFSRMTVEPGRPVTIAALAPVAVEPGRQRHGVGSAMVRRGLEACAQAGIQAVIVLGHPDFYPRFGFSAALAEKVRAPFSGPAFMALELAPGSIRQGDAVHYAAAFGIPG